MQSVFAFIRRFFIPLLIGGGIILLLGAFFLGRHMVYQSHPELSGQEKATAVLAKVEKLIELPQGEAPQMATIEDAASVKIAQPFLANAQNGDVLIVYASAQTALLYRPSTNKLIAVGPVDNSTKQNVAVPPVAPVPSTTATSTENATTTKSQN